VAALAGFNRSKLSGFLIFPRIRLPDSSDPWLIKTSRGNMELFDTVSLPIRGLLPRLLSDHGLLVLLYFLHRDLDWQGVALRSVRIAMPRRLPGSTPNRMNMLAFAPGMH
jgi:branched-chain amino acid transport system permease protein